MATDTAKVHDAEVGKNPWSGGKPPMKASYGKLMMWYFLLSDAFTFTGFLIAYGALRFSSPTWPVPDVVFSTAPFGGHDLPLIFVTIMSFVLIISSGTMVRAVQEGHRENKSGVVFWMLMTVLGGLVFLGCQAWEWNNLISKEKMTVTRNPFGSHVADGVYLDDKGQPTGETFKTGDTYLIHFVGGEAGAHGDDHHGEDHAADGHGDHHEVIADGTYPGYIVQDGFKFRKYQVKDESGELTKGVYKEEFGPKAFGALFFAITGFHGFHVFSGVLFLIIIMINAASGIYVSRKNGYEMVEKIGLYWHFVDLVWVFVFLAFYLL